MTENFKRERAAARADTTALDPSERSSEPVPAPSVPTNGIGPDNSRLLFRLGSLREGGIMTRSAAARRPLESHSGRLPSFFCRLPLSRGSARDCRREGLGPHGC